MAEQVATDKANGAIGLGESQHIGGRPDLEDRLRAEVISTADGKTLMVAMVADGIGGNVHGERAAELAIDVAFRQLAASTVQHENQLPGLLQNVLEAANTAVFEEAREDRSKRGMGTTATLAAIYNNKLFLANVGDSRAYLIRDGSVQQLTCDQTWANEMRRKKTLTEKEIERHPKRDELVSSIGYGSQVVVDLGLYLNGEELDSTKALNNQGLPLQTNDRLLLCSDGLIKNRPDGLGPYVVEEEIVRLVTQNRPPAAAKALVQKALSRGADDNVSTIVLEMPGSKRAFHIPPALLYGAIGLIALIILGALLLSLFSNQPEAAAESPAGETPLAVVVATEPPADTPTVPPAIAGIVQMTTVGSGARAVAADGSSEALSNGQELELPEGGRVAITNGTGTAELVLPDQTQLFVESNSAFSVTDNGGAMVIELESGRMVVRSAAQPVTVRNPFGARVTLHNGLLGVAYQVDPFRFEGACLQGSCEVVGDLDAGGLALVTGEMSVVGGEGRAGAAEPAPYELYYLLAPSGLVPAPTPTPAATSTPMPTDTPVPTNTRPRGATAPPPTATIPLLNTLPPIQDADGDGIPDSSDGCTNQSGPVSNNGCPESGGGGNDDGDGSQPPPPTDPPPTDPPLPTPELPGG